MLNFVIVSALVQGGVQILRKRAPKLDGLLVNALAALIGLISAYLLPELRITETLLGGPVEPLFDIAVTGLSIGVGASVIREWIKATAESIVPVPKPTSDEEIP